MFHLMEKIWDCVLMDDCADKEKLTATIAILHVYASLLGMVDDDFKDLMYEVGKTYMGPSPEGESEFLLNFYARERDGL